MEEGKRRRESGKISLELIYRNAGKLGEFCKGDVLALFLVRQASDLPDHFIAIAYTSSCDTLDVFGVDDASFDVHGQLKMKVIKN